MEGYFFLPCLFFIALTAYTAIKTFLSIFSSFYWVGLFESILFIALIVAFVRFVNKSYLLITKNFVAAKEGIHNSFQFIETSDISEAEIVEDEDNSLSLVLKGSATVIIDEAFGDLDEILAEIQKHTGLEIEEDQTT